MPLLSCSATLPAALVRAHSKAQFRLGIPPPFLLDLPPLVRPSFFWVAVQHSPFIPRPPLRLSHLNAFIRPPFLCLFLTLPSVSPFFASLNSTPLRPGLASSCPTFRCLCCLAALAFNSPLCALPLGRRIVTSSFGPLLFFFAALVSPSAVSLCLLFPLSSRGVLTRVFVLVSLIGPFLPFCNLCFLPSLRFSLCFFRTAQLRRAVFFVFTPPLFGPRFIFCRFWFPCCLVFC